jgi:hypothetical protein
MMNAGSLATPAPGRHSRLDSATQRFIIGAGARLKRIEAAMAQQSNSGDLGRGRANR